jgi:hypothetical protein
MKNNTIKILVLVVIIISILIVRIIIEKYDYFNKKETTNPLTLKQARQIAVERIINDYNYQNLNGYDINPIKDPIKCGDDCFQFDYEYKVNQTKIKDLEKIKISMIIEGGNIKNQTSSEITFSQKRI